MALYLYLVVNTKWACRLLTPLERFFYYFLCILTEYECAVYSEEQS
jgi:hypothetical protein